MCINIICLISKIVKVKASESFVRALSFGYWIYLGVQKSKKRFETNIRVNLYPFLFGLM